MRLTKSGTACAKMTCLSAIDEELSIMNKRSIFDTLLALKGVTKRAGADPSSTPPSMPARDPADPPACDPLAPAEAAPAAPPAPPAPAPPGLSVVVLPLQRTMARTAATITTTGAD